MKRREDEAAIQILIGSLITNSHRCQLDKKFGMMYRESLLLQADATYHAWKMKYFKRWNAISTNDGITFPIPDHACARIDAGIIANGNTMHLFKLLEPLGLAVWFMEDGKVENNKVKLKLPVSWSANEILMQEFVRRFDARPNLKGPCASLIIDDVEHFKDVIFTYVIPVKRHLFSLSDTLHDVSSTEISTAIGIQKVGIRDVPVQLNIHLRNEIQPTIARASLYTSLNPEMMGSHLSRLMAVLNTVSSNTLKTDLDTLQEYLQLMRTKLSANDAYLKFRFPILLSQAAPVSGIESKIRYECTLQGEIVGDTLKVYKKIKVPYMSACVCSKSISMFNAHCQRSFADVTVLLRNEDINFEEIIEIVESSCSAPIRALLKREDEKYITETAYEFAGFVESISRGIARKLDILNSDGWSVCCEHEESLHQHNAVSIIRGGKEYVW